MTPSDYISFYDSVCNQLDALGKDIQFSEEDHKYFVGGKEYISVTTLLGSYKEPFDAPYWAAKKALELNLEPAAVLERWDRKAAIARSRGTIIHQFIEYYLRGKPTPELPEKLKESITGFLDELHKSYTSIRSELRIKDDEFGVCGTVDQIFLDRNTGLLHIFDWKTNEKITTESRYKLINGMSHLNNSDLNVYSLQTGIYKKIIEKNTNLKFGESFIVHIGHDHKITKMETVDYQRECLSILRR